MIKHVTLTCLMALMNVYGPTWFAQGKNVAKEELPMGEAVLDKHIEVTGGAEAWGKIKNISMKGTATMLGMGRTMSGNATLYGCEPNLSYKEMRIDGIGSFVQACDGKNVWNITPDGRASIKSGKVLETVLEGNILNEANWRDRYISAQTNGTKKIEGEECYEVIVTTKAGKTFASYYSKKTNFKVKEDNDVFKDYKDVGGILVPFQIISDEDGLKISLKFREIKTNVDIPPSTFEPPPQVKGMLGIK